MKLPNAHLAVVERHKLVDYLLDPAHPDNGGKASFFQMLGFDREHWLAFANALRELAATCEVTKTMESPHGSKYILDGRIAASSERASAVRSVWIIERGEEAPRLVTAYPHEERG